MKFDKFIPYFCILFAAVIPVMLSPCSSSAQSQTLTVSRSGTGSGTITSSPDGIDCGTACSQTYQPVRNPVKVTLKANADAASYFAGWSGACTGAKPSCVVTMDGDKDVTARFAPDPVLNITKSGDGAGTVVSVPTGINCDAGCTNGNAQYKYNLRLTLKVKTDMYSTFLGWEGDCQSQGAKPVCALRMDSDKNVSARFGLPDISLSPTSYDFGSAAVKRSTASLPFTVHNSGTGNLEIDSMRIIGADQKVFRAGGSRRKTVPPGGDYRFTTTFKPPTAGAKNAALEIASNDPDTPLIEIPLSGSACAENRKVTVCSGTVDQCLNISCGWELDGKAVSDQYFCDGSVVRLPDGRYRMYGNSPTHLADGRAIDSWISGDGVVFEKEPGFRLVSPGDFLPDVVPLPDGRFRMYLTDQSVAVGYAGARAIRSAISTDGLNFAEEEGDRLTYLGDGYESGGIRGAKVLTLNDGTYRMYYTGIREDVSRVLSAVSPDGLNWVREQGVRIDPQVLCPANPDIGASTPFVDSHGVIHQYIWTVTCKNQNWLGSVAGMFDFTSVDGLTFNPGAAPLITGYYFKDVYTGKPADPAARMDNAPVIMTPDGLRAYLYTYCPQTQCADWSEMGYYSMVNSNIRW